MHILIPKCINTITPIYLSVTKKKVDESETMKLLNIHKSDITAETFGFGTLNVLKLGDLKTRMGA